MVVTLLTRWTRWACMAAFFACLYGFWPAAPGRAATTEVVISDPLSGLAIFGFDPVAFFVDQEAREGLSAYELKYAGVVWRFRNEGNRSAFEAMPNQYMPRFGGYDPLAAARGVPVAGFPSLYALYGGRLFLFANKESRKLFLDSPDEVITAAEVAWPKVLRSLTP
jgi:YHS domain-containing protein